MSENSGPGAFDPQYIIGGPDDPMVDPIDPNDEVLDDDTYLPSPYDDNDGEGDTDDGTDAGSDLTPEGFKVFAATFGAGHLRSYNSAQIWAEYQRSHSTGGWSNQCQRFSRSCVGAGAWASSARRAFNAIPARHRHTSFPPPPGSIAYYGSATSGNGHTAFVSAKPGYVYSTDIKRPGKIDLVPWNVFASAWGMRYRGWIDWTPSGPINFKPAVVRPTPAHVIKPTVRLSRIIKAAQTDPKYTRIHKTYPTEVLIVEKALNRAGTLASAEVDGSFRPKTKSAYAAWQRHLGYSGKDANGIPGMKSLTALGAKYGFRVAP